VVERPLMARAVGIVGGILKQSGNQIAGCR
jgi:hypothetical protein